MTGEGLSAVEDCADIFQASVTRVRTDTVPVPEPKSPPQRIHRQRARGLRPGEEVRLTEGGPWYRVERVNDTAAYIAPLYLEPVLAKLPNGRPSQARSGGHLIPVSPTSFVVERR